MILNDLFFFIKERTGIDVNINSIVFDDLGIDGLDAEIFMEDFFKHFEVEKGDFSIDEYRTSENKLINIFASLWERIFNKNELLTFKVEHLLQVVELGKWFNSK